MFAPSCSLRELLFLNLSTFLMTVLVLKYNFFIKNIKKFKGQ